MVSWDEHKSVLDAGGGNGILLKQLLKNYPHLEAVLIELPEVINQIPEKEKNQERINYIGKDFFTPWNVSADAIIFSRVLHDWPDHLALALLERAKQSLTSEGKIYVIEMIVDQNSPRGGLLDLNMFVMTGGCERTLQDWKSLFAKANLNLSKTIELSTIVSILELTA